MNAGDVVLVIFAMGAGLGAIAIITEHFQKLAQIRAKARAGADEGAAKSIDELRREIMALRETATQYDVSFDAALQRLEQRVAQMELRLSSVEQNQTRVGRE
jgi:hypothetical protein